MNSLLTTALFLAAALYVAPAAGAEAANNHDSSDREPLMQSCFVALPLGSVKPLGWLRDQLVVQANGLTGHLDEFWPDVANSAWKGADGDAWERAPYYLDGLVSLAYLLDDAGLIAKAKPFIEYILASGQPDGWFGPPQNRDRWPLAVAMKVLTQYYEATGDERALTLLRRYFAYLKDTPPDWPANEWRGVRAAENAVTAFWLYKRTGDADALDVARSIRDSSYDWTSYFLDFPHTTKALEQGLQYDHTTHAVNIAMALKEPGLWYLLSGDERCKRAVFEGIASLDEHHGQVGGRFSGDEHLSGRRPTQGTETCAVVEYMFSLETLVEILGDVALADRLEQLAYNAYPGACTADCWARQYDQQANQVLVSVAPRHWSTNGDGSNVYGLETHYGCCTANMHQAWPKFVSHMWMATHNQGLAAVAYGPSRVTAKVADGVEVTIVETTDYPFDGVIRFELQAPRPVSFPLHVRIPAWAEGAQVAVVDKTVPVEAGTFAVVNREWRPGDVVVLTLPMRVRTETRYNNSISVLRGPLVFSLKIGEQYTKLASHHDTLPTADWEIRPTTPWNYGLLLDRADPDKDVSVVTRKPGTVPFAQENAPVVLKVKGRALPGWQLVDNSAGDPPPSPVVSDAPVTDLELIPYGSAHLRISEFPVVKE
jgi:hypothetical protein